MSVSERYVLNTSLSKKDVFLRTFFEIVEEAESSKTDVSLKLKACVKQRIISFISFKETVSFTEIETVLLSI